MSQLNYCINLKYTHSCQNSQRTRLYRGNCSLQSVSTTMTFKISNIHSHVMCTGHNAMFKQTAFLCKKVNRIEACVHNSMCPFFRHRARHRCLFLAIGPDTSTCNLCEGSPFLTPHTWVCLNIMNVNHKDPYYDIKINKWFILLIPIGSICQCDST